MPILSEDTANLLRKQITPDVNTGAMETGENETLLLAIGILLIERQLACIAALLDERR